LTVVKSYLTRLSQLQFDRCEEEQRVEEHFGEIADVIFGLTA